MAPADAIPGEGLSLDRSPSDFQGRSEAPVGAVPHGGTQDVENGLDPSEGEEGGAVQATGQGQECGHKHYSGRAPWLRAALLGAQDGLVSVASLMIGVGAVKEDRSSMVISGLAGLVAGACSMAIGEYVSVYGQRDIEEGDIRREREEFQKGPDAVARELDELTQVYVSRGLTYSLARQVAVELSATDPVRAHARDELGIDMDDMSNPTQAAMASAACFVGGAIVPLLSAAFIVTYWIRILVVLLTSSVMFIAFGAFGAWMGGAKIPRAALRSTMGGLIAIGVTYGILRAFGTSEAL